MNIFKGAPPTFTWSLMIALAAVYFSIKTLSLSLSEICTGMCVLCKPPYQTIIFCINNSMSSQGLNLWWKKNQKNNSIPIMRLLLPFSWHSSWIKCDIVSIKEINHLQDLFVWSGSEAGRPSGKRCHSMFRLQSIKNQKCSGT